MTFMHRRLLIPVIFASAFLVAADAQEGPKNAVLLIIRHAEDADTGDGMSPLGQQRAEAYRNYFLNFTVDSTRREPQVIFAAKDSKKSHRPRLTMEPFAKAANLKIDTRFGNDQSADLTADLRANQQGKVILICWRHHTFRLCSVHWEQTPRAFCPMANGPAPSLIGSS